MPASPDTLLDRIRAANRDRRPDMLPRKYAAMAESAFRFFRATPQLFYQDWQVENPCAEHPLSWVCADLHLENVGSYRAENRLVYFDINDFDEALLAPCTIDVARLITSLFVAGPTLRHTPDTLRHLAGRFVDTYHLTLLRGKPRSIERETAKGVLKHFLKQVANRKQRELIDRHTRRKGRNRLLRTDGIRFVDLPAGEREMIMPWLRQALAAQGEHRLQDVAFRLAGTSSLGLSRYVALVETPAGKYRLIDVKATRPSAVAPYVATTQPNWPDQATRVVTLQLRLQDVSPANLHALAGPGADDPAEHYVMRALQPQADRMDLTAKAVRPARRLTGLLDTMAQLTASAHLRSSGRAGSANADALIDFAAQPTWTADLLHRAERYAEQVRQDYALFKSGWKAGLLDVPD